MLPISMLLYFSSDLAFTKASLIGADCAGSTTFPLSRDFGRTSLGVAMKPTVYWALADANVHRTAFRFKIFLDYAGAVDGRCNAGEVFYLLTNSTF